jgi:Tfp pilus assembly protein PilF
MLLYQQKRYAAARADLERARAAGAEPARAHYGLALIDLAQGDRTSALANLRQALRHDPADKEARALHERLRPGQ